MKRYLALLFALILVCGSFAQTATERLSAAFQKLEADSQLRSAISSLYVIDGKTGRVVFDKNATVGLATASTMKIITAASAYELLGKEFRYQTLFGYVGSREGKNACGHLYIKPSGDPTFGSWRWKQTTDSGIIERLLSAVKRSKIKAFNDLVIDTIGWSEEAIPDGWPWQDIGNYYGAGAAGFNWHENEFEIVLKSGRSVGDAVKIVQTKPLVRATELRSVATSGAKGTGDNAYVYYPLNEKAGVIRGTIPVNEPAFTISAANPHPEIEFKSVITARLSDLKINQIHSDCHSKDTTVFFTYDSPPLDSIVYWFLKKSINLYGEALVKTIAHYKTGTGSTDGGIGIIKKFWKAKGVDPVELNMHDGSGLSPSNRVTTHAQVQVLTYAKQQPWFSGYLNGFPEYNGMKMKSGTINGVKGFCGYHTAKDGNEYIFSFLVNNYNGAASKLVSKMYKVLDELK